MLAIISVVTICHHTSYDNIIDYIFCAACFIAMIYFITGSFYLLILFTHFTHPQTPSPLATTSLSLNFMFFCLCVVIWIPQINETMW